MLPVDAESRLRRSPKRYHLVAKRTEDDVALDFQRWSDEPVYYNTRRLRRAMVSKHVTGWWTYAHLNGGIDKFVLNK